MVKLVRRETVVAAKQEDGQKVWGDPEKKGSLKQRFWAAGKTAASTERSGPSPPRLNR